MSAPTFTEDLAVYVGATFDSEYTVQQYNEDTSAWEPVDLSAYTTAKMQIRSSYDAAAALVTLTQAAGITMGGVAGTVGITIDAATTADLTTGTGVYDLFLYKPDGTAYMSMRGGVTIYPRATQ